MQEIGLIDVDGHHFPNLALMRISAWHKSRGDNVEWWLGNLEYYDKVYMSKVFSSAYSEDAEEPINCGEVIKGGRGTPYISTTAWSGTIRRRTSLCRTR